VGFPKSRATALISEIAEQTEYVVQEVSTALPKDFPKNISGPIFQGMKSQADKLRQFVSVASG
jgi:serine/threonine-protein kinase HipA